MTEVDDDGLLAQVTATLADAGVPTPAVDARWLLAAARTDPDHEAVGSEAAAGSDAAADSDVAAGSGAAVGSDAAGSDAAGLTGAQGERGGADAGPVDRARLAAMVARRVAREPLQVIVGSTQFRYVTLSMRPGVFVPRPETEIVAGVAIEAALAVTSTPARVVDACTGSGAIALAMGSEVPDVRVVATEVDDTARAVARANLDSLAARRVGAGDGASRRSGGAAGGGTAGGGTAGVPLRRWRPDDCLAPGATVQVVGGSLLDDVDPTWQGSLDVLVANPPYLPTSDRGSWAPEVADHDPDRALVGGADGHEVVDALLALATTWLRPGGTVVVEIDDRRGSDALAAARNVGLVEVRIVRDLTGRDRAVAAVRGQAP